MLNKSLIAFYTDSGTDQSNRAHHDLLRFSDTEMEMTHDFIQWMFPTEKKSAFNSDAPVLNRQTIAAIKDDILFQTRFGLAIKRIFKFWGIEYTGTGHNIKVKPLNKKLHWMRHDNHNLLRMSRFMESCRLLGFEAVGQSLFTALINSVFTLRDPTYPWHPLESQFISIENVYWWRKGAYGD
jgi:hypothetical protein